VAIGGIGWAFLRRKSDRFLAHSGVVDERERAFLSPAAMELMSTSANYRRELPLFFQLSLRKENLAKGLNGRLEFFSCGRPAPAKTDWE
jgi:hypothetical protein